MAKETKAERSEAGKQAARTRILKLKAEGRSTVKFFGKRRPLWEWDAKGDKLSAEQIEKVKVARRLEAAKAVRVASQKTGKGLTKEQAMAFAKARVGSRAKREAVAAGQTAPSPEAAPAKPKRKTSKRTKKEATMAKPKNSRKAAARKAAKTKAEKAEKRAAAARKAARTRKHNKAHGKTASSASRKKTHKSKTTKKRKAGVSSMSIPKGARKIIAAEQAAKENPRRRPRKRNPTGRGYALDNPLTPMEIFAGGITMLLGLAAADISDRYWATHALTAGTATSAGLTPYTDTPTQAAGTASTQATFGAGLYPGMLNGAAVIAPMNLTRWVSGGVLAAVPFIASAFVKQKTVRTALQLFGFGVVARIGGKALIDLFSTLLANTSLGQQLYVNELTANAQYQAAMGNPAVTYQLPNETAAGTVGSTGASSGLGHASRSPEGAACCAACAQGLPCHREAPPGQIPGAVPAYTDSAGGNTTPVPNPSAGVSGTPRQLPPRQRENPLDWSRHILEGTPAARVH
jgi:hypothetical protein